MEEKGWTPFPPHIAAPSKLEHCSCIWHCIWQFQSDSSNLTSHLTSHLPFREVQNIRKSWGHPYRHGSCCTAIWILVRTTQSWLDHTENTVFQPSLQKLKTTNFCPWLQQYSSKLFYLEDKMLYPGCAFLVRVWVDYSITHEAVKTAEFPAHIGGKCNIERSRPSRNLSLINLFLIAHEKFSHAILECLSMYLRHDSIRQTGMAWFPFKGIVPPNSPLFHSMLQTLFCYTTVLILPARPRGLHITTDQLKMACFNIAAWIPAAHFKDVFLGGAVHGFSPFLIHFLPLSAIGRTKKIKNSWDC